MKELGLDASKYKYLKSDDNTTTLQHKNGHQVTIMHSALSPKNQEILKAVAKAPQIEDKHPYGKVIQKADGGQVKEIHSETPEPGYTEPKKMAMGGTAYENNMPCLNPSCKSHGRPHPNCRCYGFAEGGKVESACQRKIRHEKDCEYYAVGGAAGASDRYLIQPNETAEPTDYVPGQAIQDKTTSQQDMQREQQRTQEDQAFRAENPTSQDTDDESGYTKYAKGGPAPQKSPGMMSSEQPFAEGGSPEISMADALKVVIPWIQKQMSEGQDRKAYADPQGPVSQDDSAPYMPFPVGPPQQQAQPAPVSSDSTSQDIQPAPAEQPQDQDAGGMSVGTATPPDVSQDQQQPEAKTPKPQAQPQQEITPQQYQQAVQNNIMDEARAWSQDLSEGHIEPETYKSLYDKKDTLGKIGTLFGLMVSGAGSGLTHQPNMLLAMMNKQIDNDLDAQKQTSQNRQNYVKLAQQHEMNKANILTQQAGRQLTAAETAQVRQLTDIKAKMFAQRGAMADIMDRVNKMPEGPDKQRALQTAALMAGKLDNENSNIASQFATNMALAQTGDAGTQQGNEAAYQQHQNLLRRGGQGDWADQNDQRHIPGIAGQASGPVPPDAKTRVVAMNTLDNQLNNLMNSVNQYKAMSLKGNLDPRVTGPMAVKAHEAAALYNQTLDGLGMTQGRMDWLDKQIPANPQKFMERLQGSMQKLQEVSKNNKMRRDMILSGPGGLGFPKQNINTDVEGNNSAKSKSGRPIEYRNGKAYYTDGK